MAPHLIPPNSGVRGGHVQADNNTSLTAALLLTHTNMGWSIFPCPVNPLAASKKGEKTNLRLQAALPALVPPVIPHGSSRAG